MTDKQIIIDKVDVSECIYYKAPGKYNTCGYDCKLTPNCYYKQLKCKEQECEELKKQLMQKSEVDMFFNTPIEGWSSDPCGVCKYKNCLTEIKEIAKNMNNECFYDDFDCEDCDMKNGCTYFNKKQILQKISECEVEK